MGNKCQCMSVDDADTTSKSGKSKKSLRKRKHKESVLPEDLHASVVQRNNADLTSLSTQRPHTLGVQSVAGGSLSQATSSKFPAFSLHGIQKASPTPASGDSTPLQFSKGIYTPNSQDLSKIEELFNSYCDDVSEEEILADGIEQFCIDLEVDPTEFIVLALAWKFKASAMCRFTKQEFTQGFVSMQCNSIASLKDSLKEIEKEALENFKDLYRFTFHFALEADQGQRSLPCDVAVAMWNVVFSRKMPPLLKSWIDYITEHNVRGISRDTWNMFLYLTESLNDDLSNYNDNEAWPSLFDDFVEYKRQEIKENRQGPTAESDKHRTNEEVLPIIEAACTDCEIAELDQQLSDHNETSEQTGDRVPQDDVDAVEIPGMIVSSSETTPDLRAAADQESCPETMEDNITLPRVPSSPGEILSHLHSE